nr:DUF6049 family protein [Nocardioides sp. MAH-18]
MSALAAAILGTTLVAIGSVAFAPGLAGAAHAPKRADAEPLAVTIERLTPSAIPRRGPVRVSGRVTNLDEQTWSTINLYPFASEAPITTDAELAAQAAAPADTPVGERITDPGPYFVIDELAPGESKQYSFSVPRRLLPRVPGVYWFGVHALGQTGAERDPAAVADGRARTFLPLVPASQEPVDTALVVPVRHAVRHDADGSVSDVERWGETLALGGQLRSLVDFGVAAGDRPLSWLVDPAVVAAAGHLAAGNPARSIEPTIDEEPDADASGSPSPSGSASADEEPDSDGTSDGAGDEEGDGEPAESDEATAAAAAAAAEWLRRLETGVTGSEVLGLPYGDLDVSAAAQQQPTAYAEARERTGTQLAPWGTPLTPAVAAPNGYLSSAGLALTQPDTRILMTDRAFGADPPAVAHTDARTVVVSSFGAASGGPGPEDRRSPIAMRQRLVSEAALRALAPESRPLVVVFPDTWAPSSSSGFFEGLDLPWLHLTSVGAVAQQPSREVAADDIRYSARQRRAEVSAVDFAASDELISAGDTLQNLLTRNDQVGGVVRGEAYSLRGYAARRAPLRTRASAFRSRGWIEERLGAVEVDAPRAVILSSGSGRFTATLTNGLDQPVTVRLRAVTDPQLRVSVPDEPIELAADARTTVLLNASSDGAGVRSANLVLTDTEGTTIDSDPVPIRSNRVSNVIWLILGTGVALLFATIVLRLVRRVRAARS